MLIVMRGRVRWAGVLPVVAAFAIWSGQSRPDLLIADTGGIVGVMTDEGRALSRARGSGFVAQNWLENDGDGADQESANARWSALWPEDLGTYVSKGAVAVLPVLHVTGKKAASAAPDCGGGILVSNEELARRDPNCLIFDPAMLRKTGAVAVSRMADGRLRITTSRETAGERLWSQWPDEQPNFDPLPAPPEPALDQYVRISPTSRP